MSAGVVSSEVVNAVPNRARDWFNQATRDLDQARDSRATGRHEWACFAAQQAADKAVKALHLHLGQEAWGHVVATLLAELPDPVRQGAPDLLDKGRVLDNFYIPARYPKATPRARPSSTTDRSRAIRQSAMPVRSLSSSVLRWPDRAAVDGAVRAWAAHLAADHPELLRVGYFGSYARNDWGVGSDLDVVVIVASADEPFHTRAASWDTTALPVPTDLLVYTRDEWDRLDRRGRFYTTLMREAVWVWGEK